jgi:hypothetical protein
MAGVTIGLLGLALSLGFIWAIVAGIDQLI